jgi:hypothetical protein
MFSIKNFWKSIPREEIESLVRLALSQGQSIESIIDDIVEIADDLVDWNKIVPKAPGALRDAAEMLDGPIIRAIVSLLVREAARKSKR